MEDMNYERKWLYEKEREKKYKENRLKMEEISRNLSVCRIYCVWISLAVFVVCLMIFISWMSNLGFGMKRAMGLSMSDLSSDLLLSMDPEEQYVPQSGDEVSKYVNSVRFPGCFFPVALCPLIIIMTYLADTFLVKALHVIPQIIYILLLGFCLSDLILTYEPMNTLDLVLLSIYSGLGIWATDFALRCYPMLKKLKECEGFPTFNYGIEKDLKSRFTRYRDRWLSKNKKLDFFTENERPVENYDVIESNDGKMDAISVDAATQDNWFTRSMKKDEMEEIITDMEGLQTEGSGMLSEEEAFEADIRRRPL